MFTTKDLAELFGVTERTIRLWVQDGLIPYAYRSPRGHWRWTQKEIDQIREKFFERGGLECQQ